MRVANVTPLLMLLPALVLAQPPPREMPKAAPREAPAQKARARAAERIEAAKARTEQGRARREEKKAEEVEPQVKKAEEVQAERKKAEPAPGKADTAHATAPGKARGRPPAELARALIQARTDLVRARADARRAERERLSERMKRHAMPVPALREELRRHARRMARLARVREVADTKKDADSLGRVDKLIDHEQARHERWMDKHGSAAAEGGGP